MAEQNYFLVLVARIFPRPFGTRKNTTQLAKYPRVLYVKPSNKVYVFSILTSIFKQSVHHKVWKSSKYHDLLYGKAVLR